MLWNTLQDKPKKKGFKRNHIPMMPISMFLAEPYVENPGEDAMPTVHTVSCRPFLWVLACVRHIIPICHPAFLHVLMAAVACQTRAERDGQVDGRRRHKLPEIHGKGQDYGEADTYSSDYSIPLAYHHRII